MYMVHYSKELPERGWKEKRAHIDNAVAIPNLVSDHEQGLRRQMHKDTVI